MMRWSLALPLLVAALAGCLSSEELALPGQNPPGSPDDGAGGGGSGSPLAPAPGAPAAGDGLGNVTPSEGNGTANGTFERVWAPLGVATIRPGVQVVADGSQCTSNFLFTSPDNLSVYLGFAAHCVTANDPNSADDGCDPSSEPLPVGTRLDVQGADFPATLAYTSWGSMQERRATGGDLCLYNDFALALLDPRDAAKANPAMLFFGGPTALADPGDVGTLDKILTYGDSGLRAGLSALSPHEGYVLFAPGEGGWTTEVYTLPQGIPGDSGSGVLVGPDGQALGVLVTISYLGGSNGVTTLANALEYAGESGVTVRLATADLLDGGRLP